MYVGYDNSLGFFLLIAAAVAVGGIVNWFRGERTENALMHAIKHPSKRDDREEQPPKIEYDPDADAADAARRARLLGSAAEEPRVDDDMPHLILPPGSTSK